MASEVEVNWRIGKSLHQRLQYILEGQCSTDVTFITGADAKQKKIRAHRFMLSCGSQVFEAMFQEASEDQVHVVDDVDPDTFMEILKFLYFEQATITGDNALFVLKASVKFDMRQLVEKCSSFLKDSMDLENVCGILNSSLVLDEHDLTDSCITFLRNTTEAALESESFTLLSSAALMRIVEDGLIACGSEIQVYQACMRWAEVECGRRGLAVTDGNKRDVLGAVLYQIRFYQLSATEFTYLTGNSELLNAEEKVEIYVRITGKDREVNDRDTYRFNTTARRIPAPTKTTQLTIARFEGVFSGNPWIYNGLSDAIDFTSDKPLLVIGAGLFGGVEAGTHNVNMQLLDDKDGVLADTGNITMTSDGTNTPIPVLFPTPCQVYGNRKYCLKVTIEGKNTYRGNQGKATVTSSNCTLRFSYSTHSRHGTSVAYGQIATIVASL